MATGEFYELTLVQRVQNETMLNVWHYEQTAGVALAASILLAQWQADVLPDISAIQSDDVAYSRIVVQNLVTESDNAEDVTPTPAVGGVTDNPTPLMLALVYRSARPDLSKRYSYKRFGGIASGLLTSPIFNASHANVQALGTAMAASIVTGSNTFVPIQLRKVYPGGGLPPVLTKRYTITVWTPQTQPGSQDSRRLGQGI